MSNNDRILNPDGTWSSFPTSVKNKEVKEGKSLPKVVEPKEPDTNPKGATKKKANKKAKSTNAKMMEKQKKVENEQRLADS